MCDEFDQPSWIVFSCYGINNEMMKFIFQSLLLSKTNDMKCVREREEYNPNEVINEQIVVY